MTFRNYLSYITASSFFSLKAAAIDSVKFGRSYHDYVTALNNSQWYSAEELRNLQEARLRSLIEHVYQQVPYYRRVFDERGLQVKDIQTTEDLKKLPILTKDVLRSDPSAFIAKNFRRTLLPSGWTTGSTGTPINVLRTFDAIAFESAMIWRQRGWANVHPTSRKVAIWGTIWSNQIVPVAQMSAPFWRYNMTDRQLLFSYYHLSDTTLPLFVDRLERFNPELIEGFPTTLLVLATWLETHGRTLPVKAVFTSSEPLYDTHREIIERAFHTKVFDLYGQAERVVAATECEEHQGLHVNPEYGIFELLNDGEPVGPGESGEIIGTGLNNFAMPLIRYQTGDIAVLSDAPCRCGRNMTLLKSVVGRKADLLITADGRKIPGGGLMAAFHGLTNVKRSQIVQDVPGAIKIRLVKTDSSQPVDTALLIRNIRACTGDAMTVTIDYVDNLDEQGRAKFRWVISNAQREPVH